MDKAAILLVDDLQDNLDLLQDVFETEPYEVVTAHSAAEALTLLDERSFDMAILDIRMPDVDGYELCRQMRESFGSFEIPVLFVTAECTGTQNLIEGLELGAWGYITKPFSAPELRARVRSALRTRAEHRAEIIRAQTVVRRLKA